MRTTRTALAAAAAAAMIITTAGVVHAAPASERAGAAPKVTVKTICRADGKTRVRVNIQTFEKNMLVDYDWSIDGGDGHPADALLMGKYNGRLFAFTLPSGSKAQVEVAPSSFEGGRVGALKC